MDIQKWLMYRNEVISRRRLLIVGLHFSLAYCCCLCVFSDDTVVCLIYQYDDQSDNRVNSPNTYVCIIELIDYRWFVHTYDVVFLALSHLDSHVLLQ